MLAFVLFLCGALVAVETALTAATPSLNGWISAQKETPALWTLDGCALLILMVAFILATYLDSQAQLNKQLIAQQQSAADAARSEVAKLQQQLEETQSAMKDALQRQNATNADLRTFSQTTTAPVLEHISAVNRQIDTIHLALQYHRASLQQVNHQLRDVTVRLEQGETLTGVFDKPVRQITELEHVLAADPVDDSIETINAPTAIILPGHTIDIAAIPEAVTHEAVDTNTEIPVPTADAITPEVAVEEGAVSVEDNVIPGYVASEDLYLTNEEMALLTAPIVLGSEFGETTDAVDSTSDFHWPDELAVQPNLHGSGVGDTATETLVVTPPPVDSAAAEEPVIADEGEQTSPPHNEHVPILSDELNRDLTFVGSVDDEAELGDVAESQSNGVDPREWFRKL
jgi:hypothetical protein